MKIGFIGLGAMGRPMATNLLTAGYEVHAFDVAEAAVQEMVGKGAVGHDSAGEMAAHVDVIICSLPNAKIVEGTMCGKNGVFENSKEGTIIIDMSSVAPNTTKAMARKAAEKGLHYIDAPVSGGVSGAAAGTLTINVPAGAQRVAIACDATKTGVTKVINESAMNADVTSTFVQSTVDVEGAEGYTAKPYKVWVFEPAVPYENAATLKVTLG